MEKNNLMKILILNIILFTLIKITIQDTPVYCLTIIECDTCESSTINDKPFKHYGNLFCKNNLNLKFIESLKTVYIDHFRQNSEASNICGEQNFNLDDSQVQKTIELGKNNKVYLSSNSLKCNYEITNSINKEIYDGYLSIKLLSSTTINSNNELKFSIYVHLSEFNNYYYNQENVRNNEKIIKFNDYSKLSIFIDIDQNNNDSIEENLIINIIKRKRENKNNNEENFPSQKDSSRKDYTLYYVLGGGIAALILIIIIILRICLTRKLWEINRERIQMHNNENNNTNRIEEIKKKIESLFETKFYPIEYSKEFLEHENINCSICLEKFVEKESMISLTPCNHIFHYDCLKKWSENIDDSFKCPNCNFDFLNEEEPVLIHVEKKKDNINNIHNNLNCNNINNNNNINIYNNNFNYLPNLTNRSISNDTLRSHSNLRFSSSNA